MESIAMYFNILIPFILLIIGYFVGNFLEKRHFVSIIAREQAYLTFPTMSFDEFDVSADMAADMTGTHEPVTYSKGKLVGGSVVISVDYFKRFLAGLRNIFGGRVSSYETLIDRARREAVLRMKDAAADATSIVNVRLETSTLSSGRGIGSIEVHAYGTALYG